MKKLFVAAATVIMLAGCTQNADKKESKTCSIDMSKIPWISRWMPQMKL